MLECNFRIYNDSQDIKKYSIKCVVNKVSQSFYELYRKISDEFIRLRDYKINIVEDHTFLIDNGHLILWVNQLKEGFKIDNKLINNTLGTTQITNKQLRGNIYVQAMRCNVYTQPKWEDYFKIFFRITNIKLVTEDSEPTKYLDIYGNHIIK